MSEEYNSGMEIVPTAETGRKPFTLLVIGIIIVATVVWFIFSGRTAIDKTQNQGYDGAAITSPSVDVPTSANPIRQVLPSENPIEKANPFSNAYKNPFE